jgi:hypothetical protein
VEGDIGIKGMISVGGVGDEAIEIIASLGGGKTGCEGRCTEGL